MDFTNADRGKNFKGGWGRDWRTVRTRDLKKR